MNQIPTIHNLSSDIANRIAGMQADSRLNNCEVIATLLKPLYDEIARCQAIHATHYNQPPASKNSNSNPTTFIHVIPIADTHIHQAQSSCWCHPTEVDTTNHIVAHNAQDCREAKERFTGKKSSQGWINIAEVREES